MIYIHKVSQQATRKKQMLLERKHTVETDVVAPFFAFVSYIESSTNKENSHTSEDACNESVSEYKQETFGASTPNYNDFTMNT